MAFESTSETALAQALMLETVWLKQEYVEEAEAAFQQMSLHDDKAETNEQDKYETSPLLLEHVWLMQQTYENAEAWCQKVAVGTADFSSLKLDPVPGTPTKRTHIQDDLSKSKKLRAEGSAESWEKKLHEEMSTLGKSAKNIHKHLDEFQKTQQRKAQAIQDTVMRLNNAIEACQNRLSEELSQSSSQIAWFRTLLQDVDSVISKTNENLQGSNWGQSKHLASFCQTMADRMSKIDSNLNKCIESCSGLQAEVPKSEINRIVGEIGKLSLFKKKQGTEKFGQKQELVSKMLKELMRDRHELDLVRPSDSSDSSMEGNVSSSFSTPDSDSEKDSNKKKAQKMKKDKRSKNLQKSSTHLSVTGNRNNNNVATTTKSQSKQNKRLKSAPNGQKMNGNQGSVSTPKKRNAQGSQSAAQKKQDVFKFKGSSQATKSPFFHQPGILGPRPNAFGQGDLPQHGSFRFQNFNSLGQGPHSVGNISGIHSLPGSGYPHLAGAGNFSFSGLQQNVGLDVGLQGQSMNFSMSEGRDFDRGYGNHLKQSKLFQMQENQGRDSGFGYAYGHGLSGRAAFGGNVEQQLNDIAQKLRQMQLVATQDYQLQQLMQETQRLKQILAQKQHPQHQHRDHFQQQFQVLINAFLQQQQMQAQQQPQPKMAKSMASHQQRMFHNRQHHLHQQQKKQKQQQNKFQAVRQEVRSKQEATQNQIQGQRKGGTVASEKKGKQDSATNSGSGVRSGPRKLPNKNSKLVRIGMFNPFAQGDKHRASVSSMVVLEEIGCLVVVDIINSCLKLYDVSDDGSSSSSLNHRLVTRLELPRPYHMTQLAPDKIVISRAGNTLSVVKVSKRRLEFLRDLKTNAQYFGLTYVEEGVVACAAFKDDRIDLVCIQDDLMEVGILVSDCKGPELVASLGATNSIVFVERTQDICIRLVCVSTEGTQLFANDLDSEPSDVWNVACIGDRIVCSSKRDNKLKLYSRNGNFLADLTSPGGTLKKPFALAFSDSGNLYVANDGAWDEEFKHNVTTEINVFGFS